jgi:hypothetical protein
MTDIQILLLLAPLILLQLILQIFAIIDIIRGDRQVKGGNKAVWVLIVLLGSMIGTLVYFFAGRENA